MKVQSNELQTFLGRTVNGVLVDDQDGTINPLEDFPAYLPALLASQPAFKGLNEYKEEKATESVAEKKEQLGILLAEITAGTEETNYDIAHVLHGFQCLYSMAVRGGYEAGLAAGIQQAVSKSTKQA